MCEAVLKSCGEQDMWSIYLILVDAGNECFFDVRIRLGLACGLQLFSSFGICEDEMLLTFEVISAQTDVAGVFDRPPSEDGARLLKRIQIDSGRKAGCLLK